HRYDAKPVEVVAKYEVDRLILFARAVPQVEVVALRRLNRVPNRLEGPQISHSVHDVILAGIGGMNRTERASKEAASTGQPRNAVTPARASVGCRPCAGPALSIAVARPDQAYQRDRELSAQTSTRSPPMQPANAE